MRSREFLMKDAYLFHTSQESPQETYDAMYAAYSRIFQPYGADFAAGTGRYRFYRRQRLRMNSVLAQSGEDDIVFRCF